LRGQANGSAGERVAQLYSVERVAQMWVDLYQRAAGKTFVSGVGFSF